MGGAETEVTASTVIGLGGSALLLAALAITGTRSSPDRVLLRRIVFLAFFLLAFVPVYGLPVAGYVRGAIGDLSVTTLILLSAATVSRLRGKRLYDSDGFRLLMLLAASAGLLLYPSALGLTYFDAYVIGYGSKGFIASLAFLSLAAAYFGRNLVAICLTGAVLGYSLGILESANLWDYLMDPLLVVYALFWLIGNKSVKQMNINSLTDY